MNKILKILHGQVVELYDRDGVVTVDCLHSYFSSTDDWYVYSVDFTENQIDYVVVYTDSRRSEIHLKQIGD
jgi:hypothetical protein